MARRLAPVLRGEVQVRDRILRVARPVTVRSGGLIAVPADRAPMHLAVHAVATGSHETDVPVTPGHSLSEVTETVDPVPMHAPVVTAQRIADPARRTLAATVAYWAPAREVKSATKWTTGTVVPVRHVTVPLALLTPDVLRDMRARNVHLDAQPARVRTVDRPVVRTVVTHVMQENPAPTPTDDRAPRRAGREAGRVIGHALHRDGAEQHGLRENSHRKS
jgi:hypothetical protein